MGHPYFDGAAPRVIGHRGAAGERPENTLESFRHALAAGTHILESDVQLTRDGVPVLCHDADVDRTTDGRGPIAGFESHALAALDAGYHFSPDGGASHPFRDRGLRIPTLRAAFEALPDARFNLELKDARPELVRESLALVAEYARADRTLLTAGDDGTMKRLREEVAGRGVAVALGACTGDVVAFVRAALEGSEPPGEVMALQIPESFGGRPLVTRELLRAAHARGVEVHVWTINDPATMHELLDLGVDGIVTDHPARLVAVLAERRGDG
ncbi:MAG: glycerophosphodiester phosphodiesterase [Myxococcota bacterium]